MYRKALEDRGMDSHRRCARVNFQKIVKKGVSFIFLIPLQLLKEFSSDIGLKNKEQPFCQPYSVKARILLYAHLARNDLPPKTLDQGKKTLMSC